MQGAIDAAAIDAAKELRAERRPDLASLGWQLDELPLAVEALGQHAGLISVASAARAQRLKLPERDAELDHFVRASAGWLGVEAESVAIEYGNLERVFEGPGPLLVPSEPAAGPRRWFAIAGCVRGQLRLLTPERSVARVPLAELAALLRERAERAVLPEVDVMLEGAALRGSRRAQVQAALLHELLDSTRVGAAWFLREHPQIGLWPRLRRAGFSRRLALLALAHAVSYTAMILMWVVIGRGALSGRVDPGWSMAWMLLLFTSIPVRLCVTWLSASLSIALGTALKQRLLIGALGTDPDSVRQQGVGQFLGQVIESTAIESSALDGGHYALMSALELVGALALLLWFDARGLALLLVGWSLFGAVEIWRVVRRRVDWTEARRALTHELVEEMLAYRTRLAQQVPGRWHDEEDRRLAGYLGRSTRLDRAMARLAAILPRGWLALSLVFVIMTSAGLGAADVGTRLGALLLAYRALGRLPLAVHRLAAAHISAALLRPALDAARHRDLEASPAHQSLVGNASPVLCDLSAVTYSYPKSGDVLRSIDLRIRSGERILLEGPSGGGKSTLAAVLSGLRTPTAGLVLLEGLDYPTLGREGWRRIVAAAPQFHENHVLSGSFAFNLLLARAWPPGPGDLEEAEAVCRELGLGPLLDRMPAGMQQSIGETGWKLSHGERSRLYVARALLQRSDLVVLDESFGALDPQTLEPCLETVLRRSKGLVLIAHP